jgi:pimeloyl-ACP methyl ester carboxylesterase
MKMHTQRSVHVIKSILSGLLLGSIPFSGSYANPNGNDAAATEPQTADRVVCRYFTGIPVALAPEGDANYTVGGELCATPDELLDGTTIQLLIPGATYNHSYWNFGRVGGMRYSYSRDVVTRGFPTFALDELGEGDTSRPPSEQMTMDAAAFVAHQIVQALRSGSINGVQFGKVILVGHSLGSVVVWDEAINYGDVDGVIVTGAAHFLTAAFLDLMLFYPAVNDPKFSDSGLDNGWLTTVPDIRAEAFYSASDSDPAVIALDEERKDIVPGPKLMTGLPIVLSDATLAIQVPVLTIVGSNDLTTCGANPEGEMFDCSSGSAIATQEAPFYSPEAQIHACAIPDSGHSLSLALNNQLQARYSAVWSHAFVGQRSDRDRDLKAAADDAFGNDENSLPNCGGPNPEGRQAAR